MGLYCLLCHDHGKRIPYSYPHEFSLYVVCHKSKGKGEKMKLIAVSLLMIMVNIATLFAQVSGYTNLRKPGEYEIKLTLSDGYPVICKINVIDYSDQTVRKGWWGTDSEMPKPKSPRTIISMIGFVVDGKEFMAPMSSYADLADPHQAKVQQVDHRYRLIIDGSDAGTGYTVRIDFDNWHVIERSVHDGEFPENFWEKTVYHVDTTGIE